MMGTARDRSRDAYAEIALAHGTGGRVRCVGDAVTVVV